MSNDNKEKETSPMIEFMRMLVAGLDILNDELKEYGDDDEQDD